MLDAKNPLLGLALLAVGLIVASSRAQENEQPPPRRPAPLTPPFKNMKDQQSYAIGVNFGRNVKRDGIDVATEAMIQGIQDALGDAKLALSDEVIEQVLDDLHQVIMERYEKLAQENLAKAKAYLEENKSKPDIVTTRSGLQYRVLKAGKGPTPGPTDKVKVHYVGKLLNGEEFDNSTKRHPEPANLQVNDVIPGWTEALQKMRVGDRWLLFVPPELGYGPQGIANLVGPNELVVFEMELFEIEQVEEVPEGRKR